ncbi:MAG: uroporphyrinogen decarboxylase family protein [Chloroflexota bacterium]|nr:uroporphyrinogen decarboxylase family protein [Chloroflexota bacterium]
MGTMQYVKYITKGIAYSTGLYRGDLDKGSRLVSTMLGKPDRPPVLAQMHDHAMYMADVPSKEFYGNAQTHLKALRDVTAYYNLDIPVVIGDVYNIEVEALGAKMIYGENSMPTVDFTQPLIKEPKDLLKLKSPNPLRDGRMPYALELAKEQGIGLICAPFSLAVAMRTYPRLIRDMKHDPKFVDDLFNFIINEVHIPYLKAMRKESGVRVAGGPDAWSAFPNVTPEMGERWVLPYSKKLHREAIRIGIHTMILASLDYCEERPEHFDNDMIKKCLDVEAKAGGFPLAILLMGRWQDIDLRVVRDWSDHKMGFLGPAPISAAVNARLLHDGPIDEIVNVVKRYVDVLGRKGRFIGFLANISADTPPEHVHAAVAAFHQYGKYPIADNLDTVHFKMPQVEPFRKSQKLRV